MASIVKRGRKYRALVRVTGHASQSKSFDTHREAKEWAAGVELTLATRRVDSDNPSIEFLVDRYCREIAPRRSMAPSHLGHDIPQMRKRIVGLHMRDLEGRGLIDWALRNSDVSSSTIGWHISRLCGVLRQCETYWDISVPWEDIALARKKLKDMGLVTLPVERDRRVSDLEIAALKASMSPTVSVPMDDIIDFCIASAMRIGEVCRISWSDLNRDAKTVIIRDRKHPRKKYGNHCCVPLLSSAFNLVAKQPVRDERIFPHCPIYISKLFHRAVVKAGLNDLVLHDLRHEGISRLFEMGFAIQEVALISGHRDWKDLARYTHVKAHSLVEKEQLLLKKKGVQQDRTDKHLATASAAHPAL